MLWGPWLLGGSSLAIGASSAVIMTEWGFSPARARRGAPLVALLDVMGQVGLPASVYAEQGVLIVV